MDTQESIAPEEATVDRKELLAQQFDSVEAAPAPEPAQTEAPVEAAAEPEEEPVWSRPPSSWKSEYKEKWSTADPDFRKYVWQREDEMRAGVQPLLSKAEYAEKMQKAVEPYMTTIQGLGIDAASAVQALMQTDHNLRTLPQQQKVAYLAQLAAQYGINLGEADPASQGEAVNPTIYALQNELNNVRGEVVGWKQQQEAAQNQILEAEISAFAKKAEHFEEVRPTMIQLLNSGVASNLEDAYEKATRLNDTIFDRIAQGRQAQAEAAKREAADKAAKAAKAAAVSVRSSTPGVRTPTKAQDRRSMLLEQLDNINERF